MFLNDCKLFLSADLKQLIFSFCWISKILFSCSTKQFSHDLCVLGIQMRLENWQIYIQPQTGTVDLLASLNLNLSMCKLDGLVTLIQDPGQLFTVFNE